MLSTFSITSRQQLRIAFIVFVLIITTVFVLFSSRLSAPLVTEDIPLPFDIGGSSLAGSLTDIGATGGRTVSQIAFNQGEISEVLPVGHLNIILIPDETDIAQGAPLATALTSGKRIFGYKYSTRNATAEIEAKARAENGEPLSYSELFPGQFFASENQRNAGTFIADFEAQKNISFLPLSEVMLDRNARYVIIASDPDTQFKVRELFVCGDGIQQIGEQCDDWNSVAGDGCSETCQYVPRCRDGIDNDGDSAVDYPDDADCRSAEQNTEETVSGFEVVYPKNGSTIETWGPGTVGYRFISTDFPKTPDSMEVRYEDSTHQERIWNTIDLSGTMTFFDSQIKDDKRPVKVTMRLLAADGTVLAEDSTSFFIKKQGVTPSQDSYLRITATTDFLWLKQEPIVVSLITANSVAGSDGHCSVSVSINGEAPYSWTAPDSATTFRNCPIPITHGIHEGTNTIAVTSPMGTYTLTSDRFMKHMCFDGVDNDGDGQVDALDSDCADGKIGSELPPRFGEVEWSPSQYSVDARLSTIDWTGTYPDTGHTFPQHLKALRVTVNGVHRYEYNFTKVSFPRPPAAVSPSGILLADGEYTLEIVPGYYPMTPFSSLANDSNFVPLPVPPAVKTVSLYTCGNGKVDPGETCDGGSNCTAICTTPIVSTCIDGIDNDEDGTADILSWDPKKLIPYELLTFADTTYVTGSFGTGTHILNIHGNSNFVYGAGTITSVRKTTGEVLYSKTFAYKDIFPNAPPRDPTNIYPQFISLLEAPDGQSVFALVRGYAVPTGSPYGIAIAHIIQMDLSLQTVLNSFSIPSTTPAGVANIDAIQFDGTGQYLLASMVASGLPSTPMGVARIDWHTGALAGSVAIQDYERGVEIIGTEGTKVAYVVLGGHLGGWYVYDFATGEKQFTDTPYSLHTALNAAMGVNIFHDNIIYLRVPILDTQALGRKVIKYDIANHVQLGSVAGDEFYFISKGSRLFPNGLLFNPSRRPTIMHPSIFSGKRILSPTGMTASGATVFNNGLMYRLATLIDPSLYTSLGQTASADAACQSPTDHE